MRDDKARFGKVASFLWSQGGRDQLHLGQGLSEPLHTIQFCLYKLCRVGKEARNLFTGEIHPIYNLDGSPRVMAHIQFHALKDHQCSGTVPAPAPARFPVRCSNRNASLPCPHCPMLWPFLVWQEKVYHLDYGPFQGDRKFQCIFLSRSAKKSSQNDTFLKEGRLNRSDGQLGQGCNCYGALGRG